MLDVNKSVLENMQYSAPQLADTDERKVLGSFLFTGGEKTRLALGTLAVSEANVSLPDELKNIPDPASLEGILRALATFSGAVLLVSHDVGAITALNPKRVLILPGGEEDHWNEGYEELISLS